MKFIIYAAIVMGILSTGCVNTEGIIKIKGKVVDENTNEPLPGRAIIVQGLIPVNDSLIPVDARNFVPVNTGQFSTDSSGCFKFTLRKVKNAYYYKFCLVGDSDYASVIKEITLVGLQRNAKILFFSLSKLADFTINIYRQSKTPALDTLFLSWKSAGIDGRFLYPYKIINHVPTTDFEAGWVGGKVNSTIQTRTFADKETKVRFVLYRNGTMREIIDTITCKRNVKNKVYFTY